MFRVLGALFAILSAASFALNNAMVRRGVITGTPLQAMAVTVPLGVVCFLPVVWAAGELNRLPQFPLKAIAWMAAVGVVHFILGRYCNFRSNQLAGVNLTAPVVQLQVVVTMASAVVFLHEPCTALQILGGVLIVVGSLVTQRQPPRRRAAQPLSAAPAVPAANPHGEAADKPAVPLFAPRYLAGYLLALGAAFAYGSTPVMARFALEDTGPATGILGGLIAYVAATAVASLALLAPSVRRNVLTMSRENSRWFIYSGVLVAAAQGFFFCGVAVAPVMLVMPLLQLSLVFRLLFSTWLNPDHEVYGGLVMSGVAISVAGALMVSIETGIIVHALAMPEAIARVLMWRV